MRALAVPALCLVLGPVLVACGDASADDADDAGGTGRRGSGETAESAVVTVAFTDSSVPPPYHRSWEVTVEPTTVTMVVTSYDDELARKVVPVADQARTQFLEDLPEALEEIGTDDVGESCPGGTSMQLEVDDAGDQDRTVTAAPSCGDDERPAEVAAAIEALITPYRDALGLDKAIETP